MEKTAMKAFESMNGTIPTSSTTLSNGKETLEDDLISQARIAILRNPGPSLKKAVKRKNMLYLTTTKEGMTIISRSLVIGGRDDAKNVTHLKKIGVTHILNLTASIPNYYPKDFICKKIEMVDKEDEDIGIHFVNCCKFLDDVERKGGRVLVHCVAGVSRSVTIVIYHLMRRHGLCLKAAWDHIYNYRSFISPNLGFKLILAKSEIDLFGYSSVNKNAGKDWDFFAWSSIKNEYKHKPPPVAGPSCSIL